MLAGFDTVRPHTRTQTLTVNQFALAVSAMLMSTSIANRHGTTGAAMPDNSVASAAYHYKWRNVYFELSQTQ